MTIYILCLIVMLLVYGSVARDYYQRKEYNSGEYLGEVMTVDVNGTGSYQTVQSAIDSVPSNNQQWIRIFIKAGIYKEQITIPKDKGYIYMQGEGIQKTIIANDSHEATDSSATFTAISDNIIISGITFKNTYDVPLMTTSVTTTTVPAVAARMLGDRYFIVDSSFDGLQDTLFDANGRHYYKRCVISGAIDFIFGYAQTLFEECTLNLTVGVYASERPYGTLTAQGRKSPEDNGGFVFKDCIVTGKGKALLGRAWEPYARVIFYCCELSEVILPIGWDAWRAQGCENDTTFVEYGCTGPGADKSGRVPWLKEESREDVLDLVNISFIDKDDWLAYLPIHT